MSQAITVKVPDIGDFKDVAVIEVFVKAGDKIEAEQSLIALETDKAAMEVPSPSAGVVKSLQVKVGDKVSKDSVILTLESSAQTATPPNLPNLPNPPIPAVSGGSKSAEELPPPLTSGGREGLGLPRIRNNSNQEP